MYAKGQGAQKDDAEAIKWFLEAATKDYVLAQLRLGEIYRDGLGVSIDVVEAYKWYSLADRTAPTVPNKGRDEAWGLSREMTDEQVAEAERRVEVFRSNRERSR